MFYSSELKNLTFYLNIFAKSKPYSKILQHAKQGPRLVSLAKNNWRGGYKFCDDVPIITKNILHNYLYNLFSINKLIPVLQSWDKNMIICNDDSIPIVAGVL